MGKQFKILWPVAIFLVLPPAFLLSRTRLIKFEHLSVEDGLSSCQVDCIFQDRQGFLWFGTERGLNKYDGYGVKFYRYDWRAYLCSLLSPI